MLADDDFRVCTACRTDCMSFFCPGIDELGAEPRDRALEGAQHPLEQVVLAGRVEIAQALQGRLVEHRGGAGTHAVTFSMLGDMARGGAECGCAVPCRSSYFRREAGRLEPRGRRALPTIVVDVSRRPCQTWSRTHRARSGSPRRRADRHRERSCRSPWPCSRPPPSARPAPGGCCAGAPPDRRATAATPGAIEDAEFSSVVSHDLRAPIRVVEGFTRIVKEDYGAVLGRIGIDHLDRVLGAATRMNHMIDALLALSRLSSQPLARAAGRSLAARRLRGRGPAAPLARAPGRGRDRARPGRLRRPDAAAHGAREPARQRLEVHRQHRAGADRVRCVIRASRRLSRCATTAPASTCASPIACSASSSACTAPASSRAPASAWRRCAASSCAMAATIWAEGEPERGASFHFSLPSDVALTRPRPTRQPRRAGQQLDRREQQLGLLRRCRRHRRRPGAASRSSASSRLSEWRCISTPTAIATAAGSGSFDGAAVRLRRRGARLRPAGLEMGERGLDRRHDLPDVERLDQVGDGAERLDLRHRLLVGEGREEHERHPALGAQVLGDVEAALAFHADVEQREVGPVLAREQDRVVAVVGVDDLVAGLREAVGQGREHQAVVVDDQDRSLVAHAALPPASPPARRPARSYAASRPGHDRRAASATVATTCRSACSMRRLALRRGSSARTRPRPETPFGIRARLKPAGSWARLRDGDAHAAGLALERAVDALVAVALGTVLDGVGEQLVQRQRDRDRLALGQDPVGHARPVDAAVRSSGRRCAHRAGDRLEHPHHRQRPGVADLQAVDLRDRLHLADDLVDRRRRPRACAWRSAAAARPRPAGCS